MIREIVKDDIPRIRALLQKVLGVQDYAHLVRMGGLTNRSYRVTLQDGREFVARIPGEGTEEMIVRGDERRSTELASRLGVDARLLYFSEDGEKLTEYIPGADTMSPEKLREPERIRQMAELFRRIHNSGTDTGVPFEVFDMAAGYEEIIRKNNVYMYEDYETVKQQVMAIKTEVDGMIEQNRVTCHNDPLCENWVVDRDNRMYLIDWEYAGMNSYMWDLSDVSLEAVYSEKEEMMLMEAYFDRTPTDAERKHFMAEKIYVDFLWSLWAKTRVPFDGQPMEDWAKERYDRMKENISRYKREGGTAL